jgi:mediator of RNA polymerase II transcription subunit 6
MGHTYLPPPKARSKVPELQLSQASKENTPMPDSITGAKKNLPSTASNSTFLDSRLLDESFKMTIHYGEEYMDENPITGQPGEFHLTGTGRKGRDKLQVPPVPKGPVQNQAKTTAPPTPEVRNAEAPVRKQSKGDKSPRTPGMPKPKRRKSKAPSSGGEITPS